MPRKMTAAEVLEIDQWDKYTLIRMHESYKTAYEKGYFNKDEKTKRIVSGIGDLCSDDEKTVEQGLNKLEGFFDWLNERSNADNNNPKIPFKKKNNYNAGVDAVDNDEYEKAVALIGGMMGITPNTWDIERDIPAMDALEAKKKKANEKEAPDKTKSEKGEAEPEKGKTKPEKGETEPETGKTKSKTKKESIYRPENERQFLRDLNTKMEMASVGLEDKGFLGLRGSSGQHKALVNAYHDMHMQIAHSINVTDKFEEANAAVIKSMLKTREEAMKYAGSKREEAGVEYDDMNWRPKTPMGRHRYESSLNLISAIEEKLTEMGVEFQPDPKMEAAKERKRLAEEAKSNTSEDAAKESEQTEIETDEPEIETDEPEKENNEPEKGTEQSGVEYDYHFSHDPNVYIQSLENGKNELGNMEYEAAKRGVLNLTALFINAKIHEKKGDKPNDITFNNEAVRILESKPFKDTVLSYGGTSIGALDRMVDDMIKTKGENFYGKFMQNALHEKQRIQQQEKIKGDYAKSMEQKKEMTKNTTAQPTLGNNK